MNIKKAFTLFLKDSRVIDTIIINPKDVDGAECDKDSGGNFYKWTASIKFDMNMPRGSFELVSSEKRQLF